MESINGGLGFTATLDINDFNVSADAMNARIRSMSVSTVSETGTMEQAFLHFAQNAAGYITTTLVGGGMMGLVNSIIQTRGQFQQLGIAFDTMLGSESRSKALMDQITKTAATTPFDLMGVANGAKQLLAYGESANKVNDTLVRLGNIASGLSIPLQDIVYLYGTTMVQGRLYAQDVRQFTGRGIPLVRELATMYGKTAEEINNMVSAGKIGFPDVEKVINKMTDSGGQFYNLMEKQSKSLSGMVSNLSDAWDTALNKIGEDNQGVLSEGISAASYAVAHMDDIIRTLKSIAIGYGTYKAAIALNTLALKGYTGVALIDNTVRSAGIALTKAEEAATGETAAIESKMAAAQAAHTASLQAHLTVEEQDNIVKQLRIDTIESLLTAQQQEYLSNLNITTSSANYEEAAMSVMTTDQKVALAKTDLSATSSVYQAALAKEVAANNTAKQQRISTIESLLTAQQKEHLSNLKVTTSSANYEAAVKSVMTADQRAALARIDLAAKSAAYQAALTKEMTTKSANNAATLASMRSDVKAAAAKLESARTSAIEASAAVDAGNKELFRAQQSGKAAAIATAQKRLEGAVDKAALARNEALAASSDFWSKKKILEATAIATSTAASKADVVAKTTQAASTSILTAITTKCSLALKTLWASMVANPIGWIVGLIGTAMSIFTMFSSSTDEAKTVQGDFQDSLNQSTEDLKVNMAVLQNAAAGTDVHKKALDKVNEICKDYNKTLLNENATLDEQKKKYAELTAAIQSTTAEKIKAKYVEQSLKELQDKQNAALEDLQGSAKNATYDTGRTQTIISGGVVYDQPITEASEHIQNASKAVWDAVNQMAVDAADKLKNLTGSAYQTAFNTALSKISNAVRTSTGATSLEMASFNTSLRYHLTTLSTASKEANNAISQVDRQLHLFYATTPNNNVANNALTAASSFDELEKKAHDTQVQINAINAKKIKVQADYTQLNGLIATLNQVNGLIGQKTHSLNTEAGINERITKLRAERSEVSINGKEYKSLSKQIDYLNNKLPQTQAKVAKSAESSAEKAQNQAEQMQQKRIDLQEKETQAQLKAEQSRIAIMDEGYEKRKAQLDLQHKQTLADIQKEQNDLTKARKEAGKGGLTSRETGYFNEQRANENASYNKQLQKIFDGEIEYKKGQYELYFKWVKNMGTDVANTQFAKLIQGGASFKEYLETEIKKLDDKRASGASLSEGETNNLINLKVQYDEITGAKSAMDQFKDSLTQAISNAKTLSEKLEAIAKAKDKIKNGTSGLVGADEKAAGSLFANEKEDETNKEVAKLVDQYKDYTSQRLDIEKQYNGDIELLTKQRNTALANGDDNAVTKLDSAIKVAKEKLKKELGKIDLEDFQKQVNWTEMFDNLDRVSTQSLVTLRNKIKSYIAQLQASGTNSTPESLKALMDAYNKLDQKISDVNPIQILRDSWKDYTDACKKAKDAQDAYNESLATNGADAKETKEAQDALTNAQNQRSDTLFEMQNATHSLGRQTKEVADAGDSVIKMLKTFGISLGDDVDGVVSGLGEIASGLEEIDLTRPFSIISSAADVLSGAGKTIMSAMTLGGVDFGGAKSQEAYKKAEEKYKNYISVLDDVIDKQKELVASISQSDLENANNSYDLAQSALEKSEASARSLGRQYLNAGASGGFMGIGSHASNGVKMHDDISGDAWAEVNAWKSANNIAIDLGGRMTALFDMSADQLSKLKSEAPTFWAELSSEVQGYLKQIIDVNEAEKEMNDTLNEALTGVDFDSFSGDILDDLEDVDVKAEDVFNNIAEYMRKALIQNMFKNQFKEQIESWYQLWSDAMNSKGEGGSVITPQEQAALDSLKNSIVTGATNAAKQIDDQFSSIESEDALEGAIKSQSEETGSLIAGRLNAAIINQGDGNKSLRSILLYNKQIADNTAYLEGMALILKNIDAKINTQYGSLLSKGIS